MYLNLNDLLTMMKTILCVLALNFTGCAISTDPVTGKLRINGQLTVSDVVELNKLFKNNGYAK
jgi:hypothetical protein